MSAAVDQRNRQSARPESVTVIGAGPVGALLAIALSRRGYRVDVYEGRPDSRETDIYQGRSINIALSDRGWASLEKIGVADAARDRAIPMSHRAIHALDGSPSAIAYGREGDAIWSVSRAGINEGLLDIADADPNIQVHFRHRLVDIDLVSARASFVTDDERVVDVESDLVFAADGANSKVRRTAHEFPRFSYSQTYMEQSYIELNIPSGEGGTHPLEANALHIWPRKDFMLIALPNLDGSFTCTLFLNQSGEPSFDSLKERHDVEAFFHRYFADALEYLEDPVDSFLAREPSPLFLVQVFPWSFSHRVGLVGDSAHAIVPFYGQGMNCGFEDCAVLDGLIEKYDHRWEEIFPAYERARKPDADAIAELSRRNFVEMSDLSGDPAFQLRKKIEARFSEKHPELWTPLYSMVTFSADLPYSEALRIGDVQDAVMDRVMALPDIEDNWDSPEVMEHMLETAKSALDEH